MEERLATAVAAIENGFQSIRSGVERRAFDELQACLHRQRTLFQSLPSHEPFVQELARCGHQLVLWALDNVRQHRLECAKRLAESKQELQLVQSYRATHLSDELSMLG